MAKVRYRFGAFVVSPARRLLLRGTQELPLIPRYFDLLVLLVERREEAVHRREVLETVWDDVVVTDGALSQAVRSLRRTLGDDPRHPEFIRTVPRHGYRFVHAGVVEEPDEAPLEVERAATEPAPGDRFSGPIEVLLRAPERGDDEDARRDAAETLHALGTDEALRRIDEQPGHERARAWLRDTRWDVAGARDVPLRGVRGGLRAGRLLFELRLRRAVRLAGKRWTSAIVSGAMAGIVAGFVGGVFLLLGPGATADARVLAGLPLVGLAIGGLAAAGVGAGLAGAEASFRSRRRLALVLFGALGGGIVGASAHFVGAAVLEGLFGGDLSPFGGGFEGLVLGGAVGLGYGMATPTPEGGMAAPRGRARLAAVLAAGVACGVSAALLAAAGRHLGAMSLDVMARGFPGSQVQLDPLARLLGEATPGTLTRVVISAFEGLMFGAGVAFGLSRRPR